DLSQLAATVRLLANELSPLLERCQWVNLGGGYLFDEATDIDIFIDAVGDLQRKYDVEVFIEPGAALVRKAGFLVTSVIDAFESDGVNVAVLDTTVAHWPEVFEYAFQPDVVGQVTDGRWRYVLAGCSCLAGDVFGEYAFDEPIAIGSRIIFTDAGAYSVVKSSFFNGINLPTTYVFSESGELLMTNRSTYDDFLTRCGVARSVVV
ncbi:MAG: 2Fe-2S ferredoxin, partial [Planctomycetes bacterium]|nr:2Fe-2S ferredoxin [Planctomycetota bacterium]